MAINISGIDKGALLAALHNGTIPLGMGYLHARGDMTPDDGNAYLDQCPDRETASFDYVFGRPVKVSFHGNELRAERLYDRDAPGGDGACARIVESLRPVVE